MEKIQQTNLFNPNHQLNATDAFGKFRIRFMISKSSAQKNNARLEILDLAALPFSMTR